MIHQVLSWTVLGLVGLAGVILAARLARLQREVDALGTLARGTRDEVFRSMVRAHKEARRNG